MARLFDVAETPIEQEGSRPRVVLASIVQAV